MKMTQQLSYWNTNLGKNIKSIRIKLPNMLTPAFVVSQVYYLIIMID